ncbi:hypothetical protein BP6252_10448 [Coleophoma cylindrospora]|uniref:Xylanolytic transcriptional activator regulatory domain-containing protein n=1 Tax=Coleophoma cylindrospora TaxID=1849047 RepID=A0A3D8QSP2_9HELO|nr:hypothetical protein BP6252_10448 [Coleophoma cylindrospora]
MVCIGSLYCVSEHSEASQKSLFNTALASIQRLVDQNRSKYQERWIMQTLLLLEFFGIYGGDDECFLQAQRIHRDLVDAMRMLQLTHDGSHSFQDENNEEDEMDGASTNSESPESLDASWLEFAELEAKKRCVYSLYLLDSQLAILCNLRPMLSSLEIKYDLPCSENLWLAKSASSWFARRQEQFNSFNDNDDESYDHEASPSQGFFYEASQTLLHSKHLKDHKKLRLLWASPFAAIILVTQLQMMARELTHASCLLERPKSQRRALSVLTDSQHSQISQALKGIAELVPRNKRSTFSFLPPNDLPFPDNETPLWHSFWLLWLYSSLTLSHPDSLLVSGVVECNLPLAIATAGHLATPRSKEKRDIYEDRDVFRILNDLELALERMSPTKSTASPLMENPFISILGFKICLIGWRLVRLTMSEAHEAANRGTTSNPCKFVLDIIMAFVHLEQDAIMCNEALYGTAVHEQEAGLHATNNPSTITNLGQTVSDTMASEVQFLEWVIDVFKQRKSWPVGNWIAAVMDESLEKARVVYNESKARGD